MCECARDARYLFKVQQSRTIANPLIWPTVQMINGTYSVNSSNDVCANESYVRKPYEDEAYECETVNRSYVHTHRSRLTHLSRRTHLDSLLVGWWVLPSYPKFR